MRLAMIAFGIFLNPKLYLFTLFRIVTRAAGRRV